MLGVQNVFDADAAFKSAFSEAFRRIIRQPPAAPGDAGQGSAISSRKLAEFLARYSDAFLRKGNKNVTESDVDAHLPHVVRAAATAVLVVIPLRTTLCQWHDEIARRGNVDRSVFLHRGEGLLSKSAHKTTC